LRHLGCVEHLCVSGHDPQRTACRPCKQSQLRCSRDDVLILWGRNGGRVAHTEGSGLIHNDMIAHFPQHLHFASAFGGGHQFPPLIHPSTLTLNLDSHPCPHLLPPMRSPHENALILLNPPNDLVLKACTPPPFIPKTLSDFQSLPATRII